MTKEIVEEKVSRYGSDNDLNEKRFTSWKNGGIWRKRMDMREKLSMLWIFALFNYANADLTTLFDPNMMLKLVTDALEGTSMLNSTLLFYGAILMEIPMIMIVLSRVLDYRMNRLANITAGAIKTIAIFLSLFVGTPALYYLFFASIEFVCTSLIVWYAWKWSRQEEDTI